MFGVSSVLGVRWRIPKGSHWSDDIIFFFLSKKIFGSCDPLGILHHTTLNHTSLNSAVYEVSVFFFIILFLLLLWYDWVCWNLYCFSVVLFLLFPLFGFRNIYILQSVFFEERWQINEGKYWKSDYLIILIYYIFFLSTPLYI